MNTGHETVDAGYEGLTPDNADTCWQCGSWRTDADVAYSRKIWGKDGGLCEACERNS
jgi:hypothetical protein